MKKTVQYVPVKVKRGWQITNTLNPESKIGVVAKIYQDKDNCQIRCDVLNGKSPRPHRV